MTLDVENVRGAAAAAAAAAFSTVYIPYENV